ncbi:hypothetical protein I7I48_12277 [Histoplasma ohiense]|nr:hypothetical protein I7I48_12277 [Histoplasma ohiense (nom. inval.)]
MSVGGRFSPRSLWLGWEVNAAQSRGERPGSSATWRDGCGLPWTRIGASVLDVRPRGRGPRRVEAADGGGRSGVFKEGRGGGNMVPVLDAMDAFWFWFLCVGGGSGRGRVVFLEALFVVGDGEG